VSQHLPKLYMRGSTLGLGGHTSNRTLLLYETSTLM
jgi:hypothetical protein